MRYDLGLCTVAAALLLAPALAHAVRERGDERYDTQVRTTRSIGVEVWTDRGNDALYAPGDNIQLYVRTTQTSYVAIYDIDTRGRTHLLYPTDPLDERPLRAGKTYRFPRGRADQYTIDGPSGIEYIQVVASQQPLSVRLPWDNRLLRRSGDWWDDAEDDDAWIYHVNGDPFVWCDRLNRVILDNDPYCGSGYVSFQVERRVAYPRYLCNECHARPGFGFDPYGASCSTFDVRLSAGWVYRPWGYRARSCDPYFVYYRRDNCPPTYRGLPRYWSSQDRYRIREYFRPDRVQGPNARPGGAGGTAVEKDRDTRRKPADTWNTPRTGRDQTPRTGGGATWKDNGQRDRGAPEPRRRPDQSRDADVRPPTPTRQPVPEKRSWINNLIRGNSGQGWGNGDRQSPPPAAPAPDRAPPPAPQKSEPPRNKDQDRRSK